MNVILASASPRRTELLSKIGIEHKIMPSDAPENLPDGIASDEAVKLLSKKKCLDICEKTVDSVVIGADTVVAFDGKILGKPEDEDDAFAMLKMLSGRSHDVYTGVCISNGKKISNFAVKTTVTFYSLTDDEIKSYIQTGEPMDKAGSYGIQGNACIFVKEIHGDYYNVIGLPIAELFRELKNF